MLYNHCSNVQQNSSKAHATLHPIISGKLGVSARISYEQEGIATDQDRRDFLQDSARLGAVALTSATLWHIDPALAQNGSGRELATLSIDRPFASSRQLETHQPSARRTVARLNQRSARRGRAYFPQLVHDREAMAAADRVDAAPTQRGKATRARWASRFRLRTCSTKSMCSRSAAQKCWLARRRRHRDSTVVERLKKAGAGDRGPHQPYRVCLLGPGGDALRHTEKYVRSRRWSYSWRLDIGGAISVTDGMVAGAIGTDTGGSIRIPAALNGLVGFKPTARRVPRDGVLPLSFTLDSVGPIAKTVADCALLDQVLTAETDGVPAPARLRGLRFAVPKTVFQDDLSPAVANAFTAALVVCRSPARPSSSLPMAEFAQAAAVNPGGAITSTEAFSWHRRWLKDRADKYDPRVLFRIRRGETITAADYIEMLRSTRAASSARSMPLPTATTRC